MSGRHAFILASLLFVFTLFSASPASGQYCIGSTAYIIRDETGKVMPVPELEKLVVKVNGIGLQWHRPDPRADVTYFQFENVINYEKALRRVLRIGGELRNPLRFGEVALCGKIGDLIIHKANVEMRLVFDIGEHNTYYEIDSLPFQEGTFHLKSLKCADGAAPPMIDNNTVGTCFVSASNWEPADITTKRIVIPSETWMSGRSTGDCGGNTTEVITTEKRFAEFVRENPLMNNPNYIPAVDFKTQIVLIQYRGSDRGSRGNGPLTVDANGDLTFGDLSVHKAAPGSVPRCDIRLWSVYRSGIKSVEGKPVPPVSTTGLTPLGANPFRERP